MSQENANELNLDITHDDLKYNNMLFIHACDSGDLEKVKLLLTSSKLTENVDIHTYDDMGFQRACRNGHLDVVKYLLTSPELKEHANISTDDDWGFQKACEYGHLDVVRYLLTSPDLKERADIHAGGEEGFHLACENGHLSIVQYLLTSDELQEHADIHARDNNGFRCACEYEKLEVVQYLLTSLELKEHNYVTDYIDFNSIQDFADEFGEEFTANIIINFQQDNYERLKQNPSDMEYALNLFDNLSPEVSKQIMETNGEFLYDFYFDNQIDMPDNLKEHVHRVDKEHYQEQEIYL